MALVEEQLQSQRFSRCSPQFCGSLRAFWKKKVDEVKPVTQNSLDDAISAFLFSSTHFGRRHIEEFMALCAVKYLQKFCEPGTPCGAIAAQSVGEPSTQMTLRTFHFAGVASMSITQGVPRLTEVINANKNISTPVVRAPLLVKTLIAAQATKARIESTKLKEVTLSMTEVVTPSTAFIRIQLNRKLINELQLDLDSAKVRLRILEFVKQQQGVIRNLEDRLIAVGTKDVLEVHPWYTYGEEVQFRMKFLLGLLPMSPSLEMNRSLASSSPNSSREVVPASSYSLKGASCVAS